MNKPVILAATLALATLAATGCDDPYVTCDHDLTATTNENGETQVIDWPQVADDSDGDGVVVFCVRPS